MAGFGGSRCIYVMLINERDVSELRVKRSLECVILAVLLTLLI